MKKFYLLVRTSDDLYRFSSIKILLSIHGWSCIIIDEYDYQLIIRLGMNYFEISESDMMGFSNFGNSKKIKTTSLVDENNITKIKVPVTQELYDSTLNSMKIFAKVLLEEEFDKRFNKLRYNGSKLEVETWSQQADEVEKYHSGNETPLLNLISESKQISLQELVNLIEIKIQEYNNCIKNLYIELVSLKTEFNNCATIEDINVLYAKYFGQFFYISPEYKQNDSEIFNENGEFKFKVPISYGF